MEERRGVAGATGAGEEPPRPRPSARSGGEVRRGVAVGAGNLTQKIIGMGIEKSTVPFRAILEVQSVDLKDSSKQWTEISLPNL